jgi:hypothetical protein
VIGVRTLGHGFDGDGGLDCLERLLLGVGESPFEAILTPAREPMRLVCIRSAMHNFLLVVLITCLSVVIVGTVTLFAGMHGGQLNVYDPLAPAGLPHSDFPPKISRALKAAGLRE